MNICILGATGNCGRRIVKGAIERGHAVTALVRDSCQLQPQDRLTIRTVSFEDPAQLADAMRGHNAVINSAGNISQGASYVPFVGRIIRAAEDALGAGGRFWLFGGAAALDVPGTNICTLDLPGVPKLFEAHRANLHVVRASTLDWSMLCPGPMIDAPDGKGSGGLLLSDEHWPVPRPKLTYFLPRIALSLAFKLAMPRMTVYYEDAACVILDHLDQGRRFSHKRVGIALPRGEKRHKDDIPA